MIPRFMKQMRLPAPPPGLPQPPPPGRLNSSIITSDLVLRLASKKYSFDIAFDGL